MFRRKNKDNLLDPRFPTTTNDGSDIRLLKYQVYDAVVGTSVFFIGALVSLGLALNDNFVFAAAYAVAALCGLILTIKSLIATYDIKLVIQVAWLKGYLDGQQGVRDVEMLKSLSRDDIPQA